MKKSKTLFLVILAFVSNYSFSQMARSTAIWHYGIGAPSYGNKKLEVIQDTLINGILCKKFQQSLTLPSGQVYTENRFLYNDSNRVYLLKNNVFYLLYDFNAEAGDTWTAVTEGPDLLTGDSSITVYVDSTSDTIMNGQLFKRMYVHSLGVSAYSFRSPIYERIGSVGGFFPYQYGYSDVDQAFLYCYSDSALFFQNTILSCDTIISSVNSPAIFKFSISPNVTTGRFVISCDEKIDKVDVYNNLGTSVYSRKILDYKEEMNLTDLPKGVYLIVISCQDKKMVSKIIKY